MTDMRTKMSVVLAVALTAGVAVGVVLLATGGSDDGTPVASNPESTVPVTRTDLE